MGSREGFGRYIRAIRESKGMSRLKLARVLGYTSEGTIHSVEFGRTPLPIDKIHPLAEVLGIDLEELLRKLEECEPELHAKYQTLKKSILRQFMDRFLGKGTAGGLGLRDLIPTLLLAFGLILTPVSSEAVSLHNVIYPEPDRNIYYRNLRRFFRRFLARCWRSYGSQMPKLCTRR